MGILTLIFTDFCLIKISAFKLHYNSLLLPHSAHLYCNLNNGSLVKSSNS